MRFFDIDLQKISQLNGEMTLSLKGNITSLGMG